MVRHRCPHCGRDGISGLRKALLGPVTSAKCSECGGSVCVPWWSVLVSLPSLLAIVLSGFFGKDGLVSCWIGALGAGSMFGLWAIFVPLVKCQEPRSGQDAEERTRI